MDYKKPQSTIVHGGAGIYPLTTADQVILADGSRLEKDGKINVDSAAESSKLGGKAPEYYIQPRNLLDNSDFLHPVNQRGAASGNYSWNYAIDRWMLNGSGFVIDNNGITIPAGGRLVQRHKAGMITLTDGKTLAIQLADGSVFSTTRATQYGNLYLSKSSTDEYSIANIENKGSGNITVKWAALYEGSYTADTLPPYVPKGYAAELAECRRYYKRFTSPNDAIICAGYVTNSTKNIYINPPDNYPMRIVRPSCRFSGNITVRGINGYIAEDYRGAVFGVYAKATGCISMIEIVRGDSAAWNATNNSPLFVTINANSVLELIADL